MATYDISNIKLPNGDVCNLQDNTKLPLAGGTLTGRVITTKTLNQIVTGTGTAAQDKGSSASPRYFPAKWTFDTGLTATDGDIITIKVPVAGHDFGVFISIDNGTTYIPVVVSGSTRLTTQYGVDTYVSFIYEPTGIASQVFPANGGNSRVNITGVWRTINYYDSGNSISYYNKLGATCITAGSNKIFPYTFIMQNSDGRWESIVTSASSGTSKARNTHGFRLGKVLLMYANATYNENVVVGNTNAWSSYTYTFDHRYTFNTANDSTSGTTANKPIYLVGSIGNDGLFYLDATWWTQTLPSTEDGKLYIYLGNAYDYYRMIFNEANPIYWYKNGAIRLYTQDSATVTGHTVAADVPSGAVFTDTKNTAGATDSSSKLFLVGATSQGANPQTYSQDTTYAGTDGHLYSNSKQVVNLSDTQSLTNKTYNGYTLDTACEKKFVTSIDTSASLPTSNAVKTFVEGKGYVTTDTKNTAGSTDTSSKIYLVGATSQAANPQTYSDNEVYATSGVLTTKSVQVGGTAATIQYNTTTQSIDFVFA